MMRKKKIKVSTSGVTDDVCRVGIFLKKNY